MACKWKHPRAASARSMIADERAVEAVLAFLRDPKVGCVLTIAPLGQMVVGEEGGAGQP